MTAKGDKDYTDNKPQDFLIVNQHGLKIICSLFAVSIKIIKKDLWLCSYRTRCFCHEALFGDRLEVFCYALSLELCRPQISEQSEVSCKLEQGFSGMDVGRK